MKLHELYKIAEKKNNTVIDVKELLSNKKKQLGALADFSPSVIPPEKQTKIQIDLSPSSNALLRSALVGGAAGSILTPSATALWDYLDKKPFDKRRVMTRIPGGFALGAATLGLRHLLNKALGNKKDDIREIKITK